MDAVKISSNAFIELSMPPVTTTLSPEAQPVLLSNVTVFPIKYLPSPLRNGRWKFEPAEQCKQRGPQRVDPSCPCP